MAEQSRLAKDLFVNDPSLVLSRVAVRIIAFWSGNDEVDSRNAWPVTPLFKHVLFAIPVLVGLCGMFLLLREGEDRVGTAIIVIIVLVFPLPYYASLTLPRYRAPIEPFLVLLSVYGLLSISRRGRHTKRPCSSTANSERLVNPTSNHLEHGAPT